MILFSFGTISTSFTRLSLFIENNRSQFLNDQLIIQSGYTNITIKKKNVTVKSFFSYPEMCDLYNKADIIVTASGEGSIISILHHANNKPILFPRLAQFSEHVDNQQLQIAKAVTKRNLAHLALDDNDLLLKIKTKKEPNILKNNFVTLNPELTTKLDMISI